MMHRLMSVACAAALLSTVATGCYIKKETVREPRNATTVERHTTTETIPGDTEVRTRTHVERDY